MQKQMKDYGNTWRERNDLAGCSEEKEKEKEIQGSTGSLHESEIAREDTFYSIESEHSRNW
tara:strand:- start:272 stop:454 length:183 start_codon:yes stop_codon:yes gene_type:complete